VTRYKPEDSPALEAAQKTAAALAFLDYAKLPIANVRRVEDDYSVEIHDARFPLDDMQPANIFVRVDLDSHSQVRRAGFFFASSPNP
jgi:hypothetical protein